MRSLAFFSRLLQRSKLNHITMGEEVHSIIEAVRHWKKILSGQHFNLKIDQRSVSQMFDQHHKKKIKNDKTMRWRLELPCYSFNIVYRPGKENILLDTLSRATCAATK